MKKPISKFLLKFTFVRGLRSLFYSKINPFLKIAYYIGLFVLIISIPYFVSKNKQHIISLKNRLVNSYIEFIEPDNDFYNKVTIKGNKHTDYYVISRIVRDEVNKFSSNQNQYPESIIKRIKDEIETLPWIKNAIISRNLPSDLVIKIEEYEPFAIWHSNNKKYIINKNGKKIIELEDKSDFENLLILSGKKANLNANSLFNVLVSNLEISKNIYSATWIGQRRWNIVFNNDILVKLPENNIENAWKILVNIYNTPGSLIDLKVIDLRVENKVYLQYGYNSVKELKSL